MFNFGIIYNIFQNLVSFANWQNIYNIIKHVYDSFAYTSQVDNVAKSISLFYAALPPQVLYFDALTLAFLLILIIVRVLLEIL